MPVEKIKGVWNVLDEMEDLPFTMRQQDAKVKARYEQASIGRGSAMQVLVSPCDSGS